MTLTCVGLFFIRLKKARSWLRNRNTKTGNAAVRGIAHGEFCSKSDSSTEQTKGTPDRKMVRIFQTNRAKLIRLNQVKAKLLPVSIYWCYNPVVVTKLSNFKLSTKPECFANVFEPVK